MGKGKHRPSHSTYRLGIIFLRGHFNPRDGCRAENALSAELYRASPPCFGAGGLIQSNIDIERSAATQNDTWYCCMEVVGVVRHRAIIGWQYTLYRRTHALSVGCGIDNEPLKPTPYQGRFVLPVVATMYVRGHGVADMLVG